MKSKSLNVQLVVILTLALLASISVYAYTSGVENRVRKNYATTGIYIAVQQVTAGSTFDSALNLAQIESRQFPIASLPSNALRTTDNMNPNLVAKYTIQPGQIVLRDSFDTQGVNTGLLVIPQGKLAITITVSDAARVANFVEPGSQVAIFATGGNEDKNKTELLLEKVQVLAIGEQVVSSGTQVASSNNTLVTLSLSPEEASKVIFASQFYSLYLGLLGAEVKFPANTTVNNQNLFEIQGVNK